MDFRQSFKKSIDSFKQMIPTLIGILLLINLVNNFSRDFYMSLFTGNYLKDSFIGALAGSVAFGVPVTSYVIGGELLRENVSILAITAFIMTWTTVGLAMLPLESMMLGRKFAITRNVINFIFAIIISILTFLIIGYF